MCQKRSPHPPIRPKSSHPIKPTLTHQLTFDATHSRPIPQNPVAANGTRCIFGQASFSSHRAFQSAPGPHLVFWAKLQTEKPMGSFRATLFAFAAALTLLASTQSLRAQAPQTLLY